LCSKDADIHKKEKEKPLHAVTKRKKSTGHITKNICLRVIKFVLK
jgi:hypothetical protein